MLGDCLETPTLPVPCRSHRTTFGKSPESMSKSSKVKDGKLMVLGTPAELLETRITKEYGGLSALPEIPTQY